MVDKMSVQCGKHRHVSKNAVTKSRAYHGYSKKSAGIIEEARVTAPNTRSPKFLRKLWNFCVGKIFGRA